MRPLVGIVVTVLAATATAFSINFGNENLTLVVILMLTVSLIATSNEVLRNGLWKTNIGTFQLGFFYISIMMGMRLAERPPSLLMIIKAAVTTLIFAIVHRTAVEFANNKMSTGDLGNRLLDAAISSLSTSFVIGLGIAGTFGWLAGLQAAALNAILHLFLITFGLYSRAAN